MRAKILSLFWVVNALIAEAQLLIEPERASPIIWTETRKYVAPAPYDYTFFYRLNSPCLKLREVPNVPLIAIKEAIRHCEIVYYNQITVRLTRLVKPAPQLTSAATPRPFNQNDILKQTNVIVKRQAMVAGTILGYVVSNVWRNLFYHPGQSPTADIKLKIQTADVKLQELYAQENVTQTQLRAIHDMVRLQSQLIEHNVEQLDHVQFDNAILTVLVSDAVSRIYILGALIDRIGITFRGKNPDLIALIQLLDTPETRQILVDITPHSIDVQSIRFQVFDAATFQLQFRAHPQSHVAKVNRVIAFRHYGNFLSKVMIYEYAGPLLSMFNFTNNCVKGITESIDEDFVELECNEQDGQDASLSEWRATPADLTNPIPTVAHTIYPNTYAHCYPRHITIAGRNRPCPPYVFALDSMIAWNTSDYNYIPKRRGFNSTLILNSHPMHYRNYSHYFDSNQALDKIHQLQMHSEEIYQQAEKERVKLKVEMEKEIEELRSKAYLTIGTFSCDYMKLAQVCLLVFGLQVCIFVIRCYCIMKQLKSDRIRKEARSRYRVARSHSASLYDSRQAISYRPHHPGPIIELA